MPKLISVKHNKATIFEIDKEVFFMLFDHTISRRSSKIDDALRSDVIKLDDFLGMTRAAEVPYPLFFLNKYQVEPIINDYEKKVYFGVSKNQISIASRGDVKLADISLIIKDITRKQGYLRKFINEETRIPGIFKNNRQSIEEKAASIRTMLNFRIEDLESFNKEKTFNHLSGLLAKLNIYISLYTDHYTPQRIDKSLKFSGIAINDKKCPFLFIKAGDIDSAIEPWGRRIFTVALLISSLCHGDFGPITMEGKSRDLTELSDKHFLFAEEFLMPKFVFEKESINSREDIYKLSVKYSVSPSAVIMRAFRLGVINDEEIKEGYLDELQQEWDRQLAKKGGGNPIAVEKAINRYNNPAVVEIILSNYRSKLLTAEAVKNLLCYKKGEKFSLSSLGNHG